MENKKRSLLRRMISIIASIFVVMLALTAAQCPEQGAGGGESQMALSPTVNGIEMYNIDISGGYDRYNEEYLLVGSHEFWQYRPGPPINDFDYFFTSLIRFSQAAISQKNVTAAYLYLYNQDGYLAQNLQIQRIAADWQYDAVGYPEVIQSSFVTGPVKTVAAPMAAGQYVIDVTDIVADWAANGNNYGFRLYSDQVATDNSRVMIGSSRNLVEERRLRLAIEYTE